MSKNDPQPGYSYWDEYPEYPIENWRYEVEHDDTRLGYWDWVRVKILWASGEKAESE